MTANLPLELFFQIFLINAESFHFRSNNFFLILFIFREKWREKERERNTYVREKHRLIVPHMNPNQGPNLQLWHVPWPGNEPTTFCSIGCCPTRSHTGQGKGNKFSFFWYLTVPICLYSLHLFDHTISSPKKIYLICY